MKDSYLKDDNIYKVKNNIFEILLEKIKENKNDTIICKVIKEESQNNLIFMTIIIDGIICSQFVRKINEDNLEYKKIFFEIKNLKINIYKETTYFYIKKYNIKKVSEIKEYKFEKIKLYNCINEINNEELCNIKLKAIEIYDSLNKTKFIFQDVFYNKVNIKNIIKNNYNFEHSKIYYFNGYLYNNLEKKLMPTIISSIQEYSSNQEKIFTLKEISFLENHKLINFKGKIKNFKIVEQYLNVEDEDLDGKIYKVHINFNLLKKISVNGECTFLNFLKINDNEFNFTNFSEIEYKEDTYIEFNFKDFNNNNNNNKYYNRIKINKKYYNINNNIIKIKINDYKKNNIFIQNIYYERIEGEEIKDTYKFSPELYKGKINHFDSLLNKNNYSYQFYIITKNKNNLPDHISLTLYTLCL